MTKIRIRGIYSTALTKLLLEGPVHVVQPSGVQEERFGLQGDEEPYDADIYDRPDCQGVYVLGKLSSIDTIASLLRRQLPDVVLRRWQVVVDGIYKGVIQRVDEARGVAFVDIGSATGWLKIKSGQNREAEEVLVQVQRSRLGAQQPQLSTEITIPGKYVVLIPEREIKIGHRIGNYRARARLHELGKTLNVNWGLIWRTAAADQATDVLRHEVAELTKRSQTIRKKAEEVEAPALLWGETVFMDVEFPALSKKQLDALRSLIVPTLNEHHFYKACGGQISSAVDMVERLLGQGRHLEDMEAVFKKTIEAEFPTVGATIEIEHVKLDGRLFHLGQAEIVAFNRDEASITYHRNLKEGGSYDGLETAKEEGDSAVTEAKVGEWYLKTSYFSKTGQRKGMYINLNTPIELYPGTLRYVDLEVDVAIQADGEIAVLDMEKLEEKVQQGYITRDLAEQVRTKVQDVIDERQR